MKRAFDLVLAALLLAPSAAMLLLVAAAVKLTSPGPALHWSERVGRNRKNFMMAKVRSMRVDTPQVATHLMTEPEKYLTPIGGFLRRTSLDELPQLWHIFRGEMSFVGPRPALFNQDDLVALRVKEGIDALTPGVTGWAQVRGRDELSIEEKVRMETEYLRRRSLGFDLYILFLTVAHIFTGKGVRH